ncbi:MAG: MFS transporter [Clostridiaceae bacterium]
MTKERKIILATSAIGFMSMGGMVISPALASIVESFSYIPTIFVQMLVTVPSIMMVPASLASSLLNRRFSSKRIFEVCLLALVLSGIFPFIFKSFIVVFLSRVSVGIAIGIMTPLAIALINNFFVGRDKDSVMGIYTAISSLGGASMVLIAGVVVNYGWKYNFLVYLLALVSFFIVLICCPSSDKSIITSKEEKKDGTNIINSTLIYICIVLFIYMAFLNTFPPNIALFIQGEGIGSSTMCGAASSLFLISSFISGLLYGKLKYLFRQYNLVLGIAITAIGVLSIANAYNAFFVILGSIGGGFGMGIVLSEGNVIAGNSVSSEKVTAAIAIETSSHRFAQFMTTFLVTPIATSIFGEEVVRGRFFVSAVVLCGWTLIILLITFFNSKIRCKKKQCI